MSDVVDALPPKRRRWLEVYLTTWNATEAARQAGYAHPGVQGPRLLGNVMIQRAIHDRMAEQAMPADELMKRLADQARASLSDFITLGYRPIINDKGEQIGEQQDVALNTDVFQERGHLIKSIQVTQYGIKLELYDAQDAMEKIGKGLGIWREGFTGELTLTSEFPVNLSMTSSQKSKE